MEISDSQTNDPVTPLLHQGLRASVASIVWTLCTSVVSVLLGLLAHSVVLTAFGAVGVCDAGGSLALVVHFRHALHHEAISERHERVAHLIVVTGLTTVGVATVCASIVRLVSHGQAHEPVAGIIVSAASIVVLVVLASWKRRIALRLPSAALLADSWLSFVGSLTALVAVVGTAFNAIFDWWWIDPAAAIAVALLALGIAYSSTASQRV